MDINQLFKGLNLLPLLLVSLAFSLPASSAEPTLLEALEQDIEIEEITINGRRSIPNLRRQIELAEAVQYDLFNDLVEDEQYKIDCQKIAKTGSHLRKNGCEPRFLKIARQEDVKTQQVQRYKKSRGTMASDGIFYPLEKTTTHVLTRQESRKYEELNQELIRLGSENEALGNAIIEVHQLRLVLKELTREKFWQDRENN